MALKYIFDLDHCLYEDPPDKPARFAIAAALTAVELLGEDTISFEEAHAEAILSYERTGRELTVFREKYGLDPNELTMVYHRHAVGLFKDIFKARPAVRDAFNAIAPDDKVILTHATMEWAGPALELLEMRDSLHESHILAQDHPLVGHRQKHLHEDLIVDALKVLGVEGSDAAMFDDLAENLLFPYKWGVETVLVHWGNKVDPVPAHVRRQVFDITEYPDFSR